MTNKKLKMILATALVLIGIGLIFIMFYKTSKVFGCLSCIFIGLGLITFGIHSRYRYLQKRAEIDKTIAEIIKDVEENGENSEYYELAQNKKVMNTMYKDLDKTEKTHVTFFVSGIVFLVCSFLIMF